MPLTSHLLYFYSFRRFLENQERPNNVNQSIRTLFETEKRMVIKSLAGKSS